MKHWKCLLLCSLLGSASLQAAATCYTVYDRSNRVVYNAQTPPVDMSRPIHETLPLAFPGGHMVFGAGTDCPGDAPPRPLVVSPRERTSPLLTDRRTAAAMHAPYTLLASGAALVPPPPQGQANAVAMAAPAVPPPVELAAAKPRSNTVITEMRDPPMTVVQTGSSLIVSELGR